MYVAFVALWEATPAAGGYASLFQTCGSAVFRAFTFGEYGKIRIEAREKATATWDSELRLENLKTNKRATLPFSSHLWGYSTTIMVLSLVLATPVPWKRRLIAVLTSLLMVHAWIAFEVWLATVNTFSQPSGLALYRVSPFVARNLAFITEIVTRSTVTRYSVSAVIWGLASFRSGDWQLFLGTEAPGAGAGMGDGTRR